MRFLSIGKNDKRIYMPIYKIYTCILVHYYIYLRHIKWLNKQSNHFTHNICNFIYEQSGKLLHLIFRPCISFRKSKYFSGLTFPAEVLSSFFSYPIIIGFKSKHKFPYVCIYTHIFFHQRLLGSIGFFIVHSFCALLNRSPRVLKRSCGLCVCVYVYA